MTKVYILVQYYDDDFEIIGVFSNKEKLWRAARKQYRDTWHEEFQGIIERLYCAIDMACIESELDA